MRYNAYSKLRRNGGKPTGTQYLSGSYEARSKEEAEKKAKRDNEDWARRTGQCAPVVVSVKSAGTPQTKTGRTKRKRQGRSDFESLLFGF